MPRSSLAKSANFILDGMNMGRAGWFYDLTSLLGQEKLTLN